MWLLLFFDLPVKRKSERRAYQEFHKFLVNDGFRMMQYSVYMRSCASPENSIAHMRRVKANLPPEGEVRIIEMTDKQFERMQIFHGKMKKTPEKPMTQLTLF
jgi:CRISPR-associated protein Cas2